MGIDYKVFLDEPKICDFCLKPGKVLWIKGVFNYSVYVYCEDCWKLEITFNKDNPTIKFKNQWIKKHFGGSTQISKLPKKDIKILKRWLNAKD